MNIYKTLFTFSDHDEGHIQIVDTIEIEGEFWLVASKLQDVLTGQFLPERLVRLTGLAYVENQNSEIRFSLSNSIPKSAFDGQPTEGYVVGTYQALVDIPLSDKVQH